MEKSDSRAHKETSESGREAGVDGGWSVEEETQQSAKPLISWKPRIAENILVD